MREGNSLEPADNYELEVRNAGIRHSVSWSVVLSAFETWRNRSMTSARTLSATAETQTDPLPTV